MNRRQIREEIFKILFEKELIDTDIDKRIKECIEINEIINKDQIDFLTSYVRDITEKKDYLIDKVKLILDGWTYERLGTLEKVILKMSFYEILVVKIGHEVAINEAIEIVKKYSYDDAKEFINGVLANLVQKEGLKSYEK